jgi:uncharacterized protein (TIGR00255 family)
MIRSMTGFARRERQGPWGTLTCELRTVNHRYLEISLRLPDDLRGLDNEVRQLLGGALKRGKVDANLYLKTAAGTVQSLELDEALLAQLLGQLAHVGSKLATSSGTVSALEVMRWPGVIREPERDTTPLIAAALDLLREALAELTATRQREGQRIRELLLSRSSAIRQHVAVVRTRLPEVSARMRERISERITQLGIAADSERLEQELVLFAHKMDVDEELDRLAAHLDEIGSVLDSSEPSGRRLDFLMQELNREANTLSSKSQDVETTRAAVDMKVAIEQMREQIQNVE